METKVDKERCVFRVDFLCGNCGNEWSREFPKLIEVGNFYTNYIQVIDNRITDLNVKPETIGCDNCESKEYVVITDREVIDVQEDVVDDCNIKENRILIEKLFNLLNEPCGRPISQCKNKEVHTLYSDYKYPM